MLRLEGGRLAGLPQLPRSRDVDLGVALNKEPTPPAPSAQLQQLEARVQASRAPGGDRSGQGASASISGARSSPRFHPAGETQPFTSMDCTPPCTGLPAARQALTDMEVDTPQPQPQLPVPMEWWTQACSMPQRELRHRIARVHDTGAATSMDWDVPHREDPDGSPPHSAVGAQRRLG